jgi:hypothetical protein
VEISAASQNFRLFLAVFTSVQTSFYNSKGNKYCVYGKWEDRQLASVEEHLRAVITGMWK